MSNFWGLRSFAAALPCGARRSARPCGGFAALVCRYAAPLQAARPAGAKAPCRLLLPSVVEVGQSFPILAPSVFYSFLPPNILAFGPEAGRRLLAEGWKVVRRSRRPKFLSAAKKLQGRADLRATTEPDPRP
ncbi:hypothetical protein SGRA_3215 [Saprospira grandis str. Lewin]|uniref:Uncharacterized protein n=1 Tax=Saprospira grandis (strain Lewin) TaxID=984262 RepID=H6L0Y7_SAPGL|nr:hypothetical protein SGRA_3215 [Saprospira grandis str. Lewin]